MKTKFILLAAIAALLSGCQSIADHNAKTRADIQAGHAAAIQGRAAALAALEAIKGIKPTNQR